MTSKPVAQLLLNLGGGSQPLPPHVSNDNPYSEAGFKTLKYFPTFPERFGSIRDARDFCAWFFDYYNHEHRHSAFGLHTPASLHFGTATEVRAQRAVVLEAAYYAHPERFAKPPAPPRLPTAAWINQPTPEVLIQTRRYPVVSNDLTASGVVQQNAKAYRNTQRVWGASLVIALALFAKEIHTLFEETPQLFFCSRHGAVLVGAGDT